jgi:hypothetical protein
MFGRRNHRADRCTEKSYTFDRQIHPTGRHTRQVSVLDTQTLLTDRNLWQADTIDRQPCSTDKHMYLTENKLDRRKYLTNMHTWQTGMLNKYTPWSRQTFSADRYTPHTQHTRQTDLLDPDRPNWQAVKLKIKADTHSRQTYRHKYRTGRDTRQTDIFDRHTQWTDRHTLQMDILTKHSTDRRTVLWTDRNPWKTCILGDRHAWRTDKLNRQTYSIDILYIRMYVSLDGGGGGSIGQVKYQNSSLSISKTQIQFLNVCVSSAFSINKYMCTFRQEEEKLYQKNIVSLIKYSWGDRLKNRLIRFIYYNSIAASTDRLTGCHVLHGMNCPGICWIILKMQKIAR